MTSDVATRRQFARAAFIARRGDLGLTQEDIARLADVSVRTVVNWESQGVWPNAKTRASLEKAVQWEPGRLELLASGEPEIPESLRRQVAALTPRQRAWVRDWLAGELGEDGEDPPRAAQA